jgi:tetracycline 7-halogenase / FADH2 O2-dependent halogenase
MTERAAADVAIVGSGFAGSILARALARSGRSVLLLERGRHPRFALGESSAPLAAIALERLAARHGLPDLHTMAAHGRWLREMPEVGRGLKRGFTFLSHRPGEPFDPEGDGRLLVAASPSDRVADSHWLREDVDARLVERAVAEGVDYRDGVTLDGVEETGDGMILRGERAGEAFEVSSSFVVDATGAGGFLARHLPIPSVELEVESALLYGHFEGVVPLTGGSGVVEALGPPGPYPDEAAAVHHLIEEGWMYVLPFDGAHRRASVGIELVPSPEEGAAAAMAADPEGAFRAIVARYPTLAAQLLDATDPARVGEPLRFVPRVQHRLALPEPYPGRRWLLLPHAYAFSSPLFSTGIAWSLVAVERAARMLGTIGARAPGAGALAEYDGLLAREADWIERLVAGAFRCLRAPLSPARFEAFAAWSLLYFTAASFAEASQRLLDPPGDAGWCGELFLGAGDPVLRKVLTEAERRLPEALTGAAEAAAFERWLLAALAPRDLCGFSDPGRRGLHPVDLETLVQRAYLLGLDEDEVRPALPRLRG